MRFLSFFIPSSNQWGTEDLKLLLLYLFSDNLLQKVESRMKLINLLNGKAKVNSDFISKVAHDILAYYEVTTNELICMCFEQKLIVRNINYVTCFCKKRIQMEISTFAIHDNCAFVSCLSNVFELSLKEIPASLKEIPGFSSI